MEDKKIEIAKMLIRFYNTQAGTSYKSSNEWNQNRVLEAYERANENVSEIKDFIKKWVTDNPEEARGKSGITSCFGSFVPSKAEEQPQASNIGDAQVQYSMGLLEQAVVKLISEMKAKQIEEEIMGSVEDKVRDFIKEEYGTIERKIVTVVDGKKAEMKGIQHEMFEEVLKFVANDEAVYLSGPAGSGKNVICQQVAEALGLNFYFTNAVTQEYQLKGFTDAMGNYQPTQFYKAFTEGGLFMLDEMDASIPEVLVILNAALSNGYFDFPAPIGFVKKHPNFRVIAAGNTTGHGADNEYVGRNQLDGASMDRFGFIEIDYSEQIEKAVANGDMELVKFCRAFRKAAKKSGVDVIVSYRGIGRLAKMSQILSLENAIKSCLVKGLEKDSINMIIGNMRNDSKYFDALKRIMEAM